MALDDDALETSWQAHHKQRDPAARAALIIHYRDFAERLARATHRRVPQSVDLDDLSSLAQIGLIKAVDRFNPDVNENFELFAAQTVRGHMLDELRSLDRVSRATRRDARTIECARAALEAALARPPTITELAKETGSTPEHIRATTAKVDASRPTYIEDGHLNEPKAPAPDAAVPRLQAEVAHLIGAMDAKTQAILAIRYYEHKPLAEAARRLGISTTEVSRMHAEAVLAIRDMACEHLTQADTAHAPPSHQRRTTSHEERRGE